jgi:protein arginine kinase
MLTASNVGRWLQPSGLDPEIVIATRVRLARNLAGVTFVSRSRPSDQELVVEAVRWALSDTGYLAGGRFIDNELLGGERGQYLVERHLASPDFAESKARRGFFVTQDETISLMVNEEDHLRFQVLAPGLSFPDAFGAAAALDEKLEGQLDYAFAPDFGFLTACPSSQASSTLA